MKLGQYLLRALGATFVVITSGACTNNKASSDSQGMYVAKFAGEPTNLTICWKNGDRISAGTRALLQAKVIEQFNGRTPIKFTFDENPCARVGGKASTILAIDEGFDYNALGLRNFPHSADMDGKNCSRGKIGGVTYWFSLGSGQANVSRQAILCRGAYSTAADASDEQVAASLSFVMLHELGHAIGLGHEHYRAPVTDSPDSCWRRFTDHVDEWNSVSKQNIAAEQLTAYGEYDAESVMDYCSTRQNETALEKIELSAGDVETIKHLYSGSGRRTSGAPAARVVNPASAAPDVASRVEGPVQPAIDMDKPAKEPPDVPPQARPASPSELSIHCDIKKLSTCVVDYGGGAGCLDTNRTQEECSRTPAASRKSVPFEETRSCMQSKSTPAEKMTCLD